MVQYEFVNKPSWFHIGDWPKSYTHYIVIELNCSPTTCTQTPISHILQLLFRTISQFREAMVGELYHLFLLVSLCLFLIKIWINQKPPVILSRTTLYAVHYEHYHCELFKNNEVNRIILRCILTCQFTKPLRPLFLFYKTHDWMIKSIHIISDPFSYTECNARREYRIICH